MAHPCPVCGKTPMVLRRSRTGVFPFYPYAARYQIWEYRPLDQGSRLVQLQNKSFGTNYSLDDKLPEPAPKRVPAPAQR